MNQASELSATQLKARERARETARQEQEDWIDDAIEDSFPASDPPSWTGGVGPDAPVVDLGSKATEPRCEELARQAEELEAMAPEGDKAEGDAAALEASHEAVQAELPIGEAERPYEQWRRKELYDEARRCGVAGRSRMTKAKLIAALRRRQS